MIIGMRIVQDLDMSIHVPDVSPVRVGAYSRPTPYNFNYDRIRLD